jgi:polyisoprenoid-binding protein YceI
MKTFLTAVFFLSVSSVPVSPVLAAETYTIDSRHTFPSFEISHLGFSTQRGRFNKTSGKIFLDLQAGRGKIEITVDAASINTGLPELEQHLRSEDFFAVEQYPQIHFNSDQLQFKQGKLTQATGVLTMHGHTKPVTLFVDHFHCGIHFKSLKYVCGANATGTLKRSDFAVDKYAPLLADEVKLMIQVEAIRD